jgi:TolB-like protein/DNA-binding winged helix-turn-helix (wHTH) protein
MDVSIREPGLYRFGPFRLDPVRRALLCEGAPVKLAERLFDTLLYLVANHGRLVEREELRAAVWGNRILEDNNLAQAISTLRKLLRRDGEAENFIVTVPGRGYRFGAPVTFEPVTFEPLRLEQACGASLSDVAADPAAAPDTALPRRPGKAALAISLLALAVSLTGIALILPHRPSAEPPFTPPPRSVAVLAFVDMSGDPAQAYFSDGLSEQLIDTLTRINALHVAARTSSFAFKGRAATIGEIGRRLNVGAVLEGSVRRQGSRMLITAQLINAITGFHYWSTTYDRSSADLLGLQVEIARAVAQSLQVTLLGDQAARLAVGGTENPAALDAYLRGVKQQSGGGEAGLRAALAQYDTALALDGGFARARAARAYALAYLGEIGVITDPTALRGLFADALAEADRAVALAPTLGAAHSVRGLVLEWGYLDPEGDAAEQARARELTPGSAMIEGNYANAQVSLGHFDEAIAADRRALELDPMAPDRWGGLGRALYMARRYDDAIDALRHAGAVADKLPARILFVLGNAELMRGNPEAARRACAAETDWKENQVLAIAYHALGRQQDANAQLDKLRAKLGDGGAYNYAVIAAQWGRTAEALHWLQKAADLRDPGLIDIRVNPMLDPIRDTPQFRTIESALKSSVAH